jgi:hypothetical protein
MAMSASWKPALAVSAALLAIPLVAILWLGGERDLPPAVVPPSFDEGPTIPALDAPAEGLRLIDGTVVGEGDAPIARATVYVAGDPKLRASTDASGAFRLRGVPLGALTLVAEADHHAQTKVTVEAGAAGEVSEVTIVLEPAAPIVGIVVSPAGDPVDRAILLCLDRRDDPTLGATTDAEGRFSLAPRAEGCRAIATHQEFGDASPRVLVAGKDNRLVLGEPASIAGVVVDERGRALSGYHIAVESFKSDDASRPAGVVNKRQRVDEPDGRFLLEGLRAGEYVLTANAQGRPPVQSDPIQVAAGERVRSVRIVVPLGAVLTGIVRDATSGDPVAGAVVTLDGLTMIGPSSPPATTDEAGRYSIEGVPKGPFSVRVGKQGYLTRVEAGITTGGRGEVSRDIEIAPAEGDLRAEYTGIGAMLAPGTAGMRIGSLVAGGPAEKAGLARDDVILQIDGDDASSITLPEAVQRLRGPVGSRVTVVVDRAGERRTFTITRDRFTR